MHTEIEIDSTVVASDDVSCLGREEVESPAASKASTGPTILRGFRSSRLFYPFCNPPHSLTNSGMGV